LPGCAVASDCHGSACRVTVTVRASPVGLTRTTR